MKFRKFEQAAIAVALAAKGCGGRDGNNFKVGAVIANKHRIIAAKCNSYRTHPKLKYFTLYPYLHAEQAAIFSLGWTEIQSRKGLRLWVARVHKDNTLALARPCNVCQAILSRYNIKEIYYSTANEGFKRL